MGKKHALSKCLLLIFMYLSLLKLVYLLYPKCIIKFIAIVLKNMTFNFISDHILYNKYVVRLQHSNMNSLNNSEHLPDYLKLEIKYWKQYIQC